MTVDDSLAVDWTALQREVALRDVCYSDRQECNKMYVAERKRRQRKRKKKNTLVSLFP